MKDNLNQSSPMLFHELLAAIVAALEARDSYTASRSSRVAEFAEFLCRLLQLPVEQC